MVDLTTSAGFLRRSALWIVLGIVGFIIIIVLYMSRVAIQSALFPPKPLPPTVAFGVLPKFNTGAGYKPAGNITYDLQTVSGGLPEMPTTANVFAANTNKISFSSSDLITAKAKNLGFEEEPQTTGGKMIFVDRNNRTLTVDILNGDLTLTTSYLNDPDILTSRPNNVERAKELARNFMDVAGINTIDYPPGNAQIKYYRLDGGNLTDANSLSNANLVGTNYVFADLDKIPVFTTGKNEDAVSALVSNASVVDAKYQPLNINKGLFATYPLKSVSQAYEELKAGGAIFNKQIDSSTLTVTSVSLGYVADPSAMYLVPVFVFDVGADLLVFVPAVDASWIQR